MTTLAQFNQALATHHAAPINELAFQALLVKLTPNRVTKLLADVVNTDANAIDALVRYGAVAGLYGRIRSLGIEAEIDHARAVLQNHPIEDVRQIVARALAGDANARSILTEWTGETRPEAAVPPGQFPTPQTHTVSDNMPAPQNVTPLRPLPPPAARPTYGYDRPPTQQVTRVRQPTTQVGDDAQEPRTIAPRTYDQAKAHGGRAALTFQADTTQGGDPTVMIEVAPLLDREARTYDWKNNKTRFQLTKHELQLVTALLLDMIPQLHFSNHNEKWMTINRQDDDPKYGGTIKFTIGVGKASQNQPQTVQVDSSSLGEITTLFARQCCALLKSDGTLLAPVLRQVAKTYLTQQACRQRQQPQRAAS